VSAAIEFHPRLVEEAVWWAIRGHAGESAFHAQREAIYGEPDPEAREAAFARLGARWFRRLGLDGPVHQALAERPDVLAAARRVRCDPAMRGSQEGAEVYVAEPSERTVLIRVRPGTLLDRSAALELLRRELLHVADLLDPDFQYDRSSPPRALGPGQAGLLRERYRALWNASVDGRLLGEGKLRGEGLGPGREEFRRAFAFLGPEADALYDRVLSGLRPTHPELCALAEGGPLRERSPGCPLCGFPTPSLAPRAAELPHEVLRAVRAEFPGWTPEQGLCLQCADLYRARAALGTAAGVSP
jgi:hypothetical protein